MDLRTSFIKKDLEWKIAFARRVIEKALTKKGNHFIAFTGGKDSTVLVHLVKSVAGIQTPFKTLFIDNGHEFEQIYNFVNKMSVLYNLRLYKQPNPIQIPKLNFFQRLFKNPLTGLDCCGESKVRALKEAIQHFNIDVLYVGLRWNEQPARYPEHIFAQRENHIRIHPIAPFTETDIWNYIKSYNIPYCTLYDEGYRSIGCKLCTKKDPRYERAGRDKTKEEMMMNLRKIGYF